MYRPYNYYTYKNIRLFYEKVLEYIAQNDDVIGLFKLKRYEKNFHINCIKSLIDNLDFSTKNRLEFFDKDYSVFSIIKQSDLTISIPYTSTAYIAKKIGIKSYYFDPTGILDKKNIHFDNIPLINKLSNI